MFVLNIFLETCYSDTNHLLNISPKDLKKTFCSSKYQDILKGNSIFLS